MAGERGFGPGQSWPSFGDLLVLLSLILVYEVRAPNHTVVLPLGTHSPREQGLASRATQWTAKFDAQTWILVSPPWSTRCLTRKNEHDGTTNALCTGLGWRVNERRA